MGLLNLFDPATGQPVAIIDAAGLTDMRTGAVTALGAKYLARKDSRVLGHIGARGTAYWNVRLLDRLFGFDEIRVHSRRPVSRSKFAERLARDLGKPVIATEDWESCVRGADIVVEASRLVQPEPLSRDRVDQARRICRSLRTMSAVELSLTDIMDKIVVDDWGQCKAGQFGSLRAHVEAGKLPSAHCMRNWARSSPDASPAANATTRPSCFGIVVCRCRISRSVTRCCGRRGRWASGSDYVMREVWARRKHCATSRRAEARPTRVRCIVELVGKALALLDIASGSARPHKASATKWGL